MPQARTDTPIGLASRVVPASRSAQAIGIGPIVALLGAHALLGIAGHFAPIAATAHAGATAAVLLGYCVLGQRVDRIVLITFYAAACDVYWRMTSSRAPWEFSKYLLVLGCFAVLIRFTRSWRKAVLPLAFLGCLVPGMLATMTGFGLSASREMISSSEMGLIALGIAALTFRQLVTTETDMWNLLWALLCPLTSVLAITLFVTLQSSAIAFGDESNFAVTGGFGPNQVSSALGLGILICILLALQERGSRFLVVIVGLGLGFTWATLLTFSRGGIYSLVLAAGGLLLVGVGTSGARVRSLVTLGVCAVGLIVVFASVNDFTGNWLDSRFNGADSQNSAGRTSIAETDLSIFGSHPLLGVGTEQSLALHVGEGLNGAPAHTEYTRVLAEHGLFGLVAIGLLVTMAWTGFRASISHWNRLMVAGAGIWAMTTMLHAATRICAVSLLFALTQMRVEPDARRRHRITERLTLGGLKGHGPSSLAPSSAPAGDRSNS